MASLLLRYHLITTCTSKCDVTANAMKHLWGLFQFIISYIGRILYASFYFDNLFCLSYLYFLRNFTVNALGVVEWELETIFAVDCKHDLHFQFNLRDGGGWVYHLFIYLFIFAGAIEW